MKKVKLIYNSIAGQSKFKLFLDTIIEKFMQNDIEVSVFRAGKKNNLDEYIKGIADDTYGIVVAGGDGTINRVVNAMMKYDIKVPLGIIPAGTANDFARHIKMPKSFPKCIDKILEGNIEEVDVGCVNNKYFINVCSAGLFTNTSQKVDVLLKNALGRLSYFLTGIKEMIRFKPFVVKIETENDIIIEKVALFLIFNGSSVGGLNHFTDNSSIHDGLLDVLVIKDTNILELNLLVLKILFRKHFKDKNVIYLKESWLKVVKAKGECDEPDIDGDLGPSFPLEVKCIKNGLKMFL